MSLDVVSTPAAPKAIGPYSQAIVAGALVYTAGQVALDPATMELVPGGVAEQTDRALKNLAAVLAQAGTDLGRVVKTTVYLVDMADFAGDERGLRAPLRRPPPGPLDGRRRGAADGGAGGDRRRGSSQG